MTDGQTDVAEAMPTSGKNYPINRNLRRIFVTFNFGIRSFKVNQVKITRFKHVIGSEQGKCVHLLIFLQRVSISCSAERCISCDRFRPSVCLSVRHSLVSCQNESSLNHAVFIEGEPHKSNFLTINFTAKFQMLPLSLWSKGTIGRGVANKSP